MGVGSKMQSFFCYKPDVTNVSGKAARVSAHQAQAQQEPGRINRISFNKDQTATSRVATTSLHKNKKDDKSLPKILLQSIFHAFQARSKTISSTEYLYASILHETPESKVMERMQQQKSIESREEEEEEENATANEPSCSTTDATDALVNVQNKLQDIIQRLMRSCNHSIDAVEPQTTNASSHGGEIGRGPNSWEHRVQSAIHRLSKIQELQASRS